MSWKYTVEVCDVEGNSEPADHDGPCVAWRVTGIFWNRDWHSAYLLAADYPHAIVTCAHTGEQGWSTTPDVIFEYVEGGGLCKGCFMKHANTHTSHELNSNGHCVPCLEVEKRRGPLTRVPEGHEFMCEDCRKDYRSMHERSNRDPDPRLYIPLIEISEADSQAMN